MTTQRVRILLNPEQRRKLADLAKARGKSVAEITRQAIDAGLEKLIMMEQRVRMLAALDAAQKLRDSMPTLDIDVVTEIHQMREERGQELLR